MHTLTTLLHKCKEEGILTEEPIRKFPLSLSNLHVVLKMYAVENYIPYSYKLEKGVVTTYYLTDEGLEWFYEFFRNHSLSYCRSLFSQLFARAKDEDFKDLRNYKYFSNFRGTNGVHNSSGTKQKALVTRTVKRCVREYPFDSIREAREHLRIWLTQYPIEEFKIYRIREQKGTTFKEEIPLMIERKPRPDAWRNLL